MAFLFAAVRKLVRKDDGAAERWWTPSNRERDSGKKTYWDRKGCFSTSILPLSLNLHGEAVCPAKGPSLQTPLLLGRSGPGIQGWSYSPLREVLLRTDGHTCNPSSPLSHQCLTLDYTGPQTHLGYIRFVPHKTVFTDVHWRVLPSRPSRQAAALWNTLLRYLVEGTVISSVSSTYVLLSESELGKSCLSLRSSSSFLKLRTIHSGLSCSLSFLLGDSEPNLNSITVILFGLIFEKSEISCFFGSDFPFLFYCMWLYILRLYARDKKYAVPA